MKKSKWLVALFVSVVALTGCGKTENVKEVFATAEKKMDALSNFTMKMEMNIGVKSSGVEMTIPTTIETKMDVKSKTSKMNMSVEMMGMKLSTEGYTQTVDGKVITYTKEMMGDTWTKEISDDDDSNDVLSIAEHAKKIEKKKSDDKAANCYQLTISKEDMTALLGTMGADSVEEYQIEKDVVIDAYIDKESNYITKIVMDLKDVMTVEEDVELTSATITITIYDFDKVGTITIPEEVIQNAQEEAEGNDWNFDDEDDLEM